ncbi:hypothetical protein [Nostoc sp.]|uniref:hypothetical protein n=1 Tax=Nostoc sp. TaxID=1180 RepID=UPI002FF45FB6
MESSNRKAFTVFTFRYIVRFICVYLLSAANLVTAWLYAEAFPDEIDTTIHEQEQADAIYVPGLPHSQSLSL